MDQLLKEGSVVNTSDEPKKIEKLVYMKGWIPEHVIEKLQEKVDEHTDILNELRKYWIRRFG